MSVIADLPDLMPSLLLDFANSGRVDPRIQCTRASAATCFGPDGKLRTVAANVPRIDYDPSTGKCLGLLVEEARANLTSSPPIASGTAPQTPTYTYLESIPALVNGRAPRRNFAVGATDALNLAGARANVRASPSGLKSGATYTASIFVFGVPNGAKRIRMFFEDSSGKSEAVTADVEEGRWTRVSVTLTLGEGVVSGGIRIAGSGGSDPLQPFGCDGYQLEEGSFATSYIPTDGSAVTRAADIVKIGAPATQTNNFTLIADWMQHALVSMTVFSAFVNGANTNLRAVSMTSGQARLEGHLSGANYNFNGTQSAAVSSLSRRLAVSCKGHEVSLSINGSVPRSDTIPMSLAGAELLIGRATPAATLSMMSSRIARIALYDAALASEQLQRLTA